jgi:serine/threonine protein kinase
MRTFAACGFENAQQGKSCPLCGASEVAGPAEATLDGQDASTLELPEKLARARRRARSSSATLGQIFGERYRADALIGAGGMGEVFRAHDLVEEREVALKTLHPAAEGDRQRAERFKREIGILSKITHPAVPRIYGWGTREGQLYFVSELVEGHDVKLDIQTRGAWPPSEAVGLTATVADALAAAHEQGIVHRDVKPSNIMIGTDGSVRLLDFGLARGVGIDMTTLTKTGMVIGTPGYMSPEQFQGDDVDERSDIYSLGVVLFELLTARLPFMAKSPVDIALKHRTEPPPLPRVLQPDVPAWLERIVLRCLEKDPAERFDNARALAGELRRPRAGRRRATRLPTGDLVVEDDSEATSWALVLESPAEKTGWSEGMALHFQGRFYRLEQIVPARVGPRHAYRLVPWPEEQILRRFVDYEEDCANRAAEREGSLGAKLQRWLKGRQG